MFSPPPLFRTRSPDRDRRTDQERLDAISAVIARQIEAAERERTGLERRMTAAYASAAALLDTSADYRSRPSEDEDAIKRHESSAAAAHHRLNALSAQLRLFEKLQAVLEGDGGEATADSGAVS